MYLGSSPFDSPGTYSLLQWTETCEGIVSPCAMREPTTIRFADDPQWYPIGGFHQVVQSLVNIAQFHGATFHFSSPVASVNYSSSGRATGVTLVDGETREADVVVVNADLVWAHNNLFVKQGKGAGEKDGGKKDHKQLLNPRLARRLVEKPHSCSSISFYWAMDRQIPSLNAHNIFLVGPARMSRGLRLILLGGGLQRVIRRHLQAQEHAEGTELLRERPIQDVSDPAPLFPPS